MARKPRVVGIDPSLTGTGVAHHTGALLTIKTRTRDGDRRLCEIARVINSVECELVVMEDLPRNAMGAGITGMVQGVIRENLQARRIPYITTSPATLKKFSTGKGNAKKPDMRAAWLEHSGHDNPDDNQVDAALLREIGLYLTGQRPSTTPAQADSVAALQPQVDAILAGYQLN